MRNLWPLIALFVLLMATSCTTSFAQLETSYVPHDQGRPVQVYPRLKGEACEYKLFGLIGIAGDRSTNAAIAKMTRGSAKIDNLFGIQVDTSSTFYVFVSKNCTNVSAYPVVYKDAQPKQQLFESNMMAGRLVKKPAAVGGGAAPTPTPKPTPTPTPTYRPATKPTPTPVAKPREVYPTKRECEGKCANFAKLWRGSDAIRSTISGQCVKKCLTPEKKAYRQCIENASKIDDIAKCNSM